MSIAAELPEKMSQRLIHVSPWFMMDDNEVKKAVEKKPDAQDKAEANTGESKLILIIGAVVIVLVLEIGLWFFLGGDDTDQSINESESATPKVKTSGPAVYARFPTEEIMAILYDKNGTKHNIVLKIVILTRDETVVPILEQKSALLISKVLEKTEQQNYEFLLTHNGKQKLRQLLLRALKKSVPEQSSAIEKVLVVKFLMD